MRENKIIQFLMRRETILAIFVLTSVTTAFFDTANDDTWLRAVLAVVVFPVLAWLTHKRSLIPTWTTVLLMLLVGSGYLYDSFNNLAGPGEGTLSVDLIRIVAGVYLTWGALILHRERHAGE